MHRLLRDGFAHCGRGYATRIFSKRMACGCRWGNDGRIGDGNGFLLEAGRLERRFESDRRDGRRAARVDGVVWQFLRGVWRRIRWRLIHEFRQFGAWRTPNTEHRTRTPSTEHRTPNAERRTPNAERRTPNAERRTPNAERRTPNAERRTPNAERRTPNAERRTPNAERRTPNAERRTPNTEHRTPNTEHRTPNTEHRTPNTEHRTPNAPRAWADARFA
ncbi:hypothetical protein [Burkholderia savannae]|uniref:hypothetical protein n=1 Tax=Burkholderia savannae TaxID=1637837 RepID=UPI0018DDC2FC|nr:hypothetical protein [Burkholderia savannae]